MIRYDFPPLSQEWFDARLALPTASAFSKILTPKSLKPSASASKYINELLVEWVVGETATSVDNAWTERGREMELEAVRWYEMESDQDTVPGGFCTTDDGRIGCSPDRLVGKDGGLEVKCPSAAVHVGYLLGFRDEYRLQAQGGLWVTGREWWDLVSYCPGWPHFRVRHMRDEATMAALDEQMPLFISQLETSKERLLELGVVPAPRFREVA